MWSPIEWSSFALFLFMCILFLHDYSCVRFSLFLRILTLYRCGVSLIEVSCTTSKFCSTVWIKVQDSLECSTLSAYRRMYGSLSVIVWNVYYGFFIHERVVFPPQMTHWASIWLSCTNSFLLVLRDNVYIKETSRKCTDVFLKSDWIRKWFESPYYIRKCSSIMHFYGVVR